MTNIIVHGFGRLGRSICAAAEDNSFAVRPVAAIDHTPTNDHSFDFPIFATPGQCIIDVDVYVDCSCAAAMDGIINHAVAVKKPLVICTTGLDDKILGKIKTAACDIPVFLSANMSLGINLTAKFAQMAAKALDGTFDIEIIERHHNQKLDAPSGTAKLLADAVTGTIGPRDVVCGRNGLQKRTHGEIGIHSIRGGTIVGEHTIIFAGPDEIIEIKHAAVSREVFARGALRAASFIATKPPGLYTMDDLLQ